MIGTLLIVAAAVLLWTTVGLVCKRAREAGEL